jgi:TolB-like protein
MIKRSVISFLFILTAVIIFAQNQPRTAVVPLNAVGVSENEAQVITGLFETALVQTESFHVIEQNQMTEIMEAQAYSISGCTDESCAIEVGKLLSAEQIILGDLSSIGGKIILNAKIIDVESGRNIKADKVEAAGIGAMTNAVELLAFKLAGLTYTTGGDVKVATTFGEVFIETIPAGAEILINGVRKGVSPELISRIPLGQITIEAKKGSMYAVEKVTVAEDTAEIKLDLKEQYGKLFIKSSDQDVDVYIDGKKLGPLGSGFFDKLVIGNHLLELQSDSVYWKDDIEIEIGVSTRVEAYPKGFGYIDYDIPDGAAAWVKGGDLNRTLTGSGSLQLSEGIYRASVDGDIYVPFEKRISITKGDRFNFSPEMQYTDEYQAELKEKRKAEDLSFFTAEIESLVLKFDDEHRFTDDDIALLTDIETKLTSSEFEFKEIKQRFKDISTRVFEIKNKQDRIETLQHEKVELELQIAAVEKSQKNHRTAGWISLGTGATAALFSGTSFLISWTTYQDYLEADEDQWSEIKEKYEMWDLIGYISAGVAVLGGGLAPLIWWTAPDDNEKSASAAQLAAIQMELNTLIKNAE